MMSRQQVVSKPYSYPLRKSRIKMPLVKVRVAVSNLQTGRMVSFEETCRIDTGFDSDLFVPEYHISEAQSVGVTPSSSNITLADGQKVPTRICLGHITNINGFVFPQPGIEVLLYLRGNPPYGFLGLGVLKSWLVKLDGPKQCFDVYC